MYHMRGLELCYFVFFWYILEKGFIMPQESIYDRLTTNNIIPNVFIAKRYWSPGDVVTVHKTQKSPGGHGHGLLNVGIVEFMLDPK